MVSAALAARPPAGAQILPADAVETFKPKPTTPPGLYGDENAQVAFNIGDRVGEPKPLVLPSGVSTDRLSEGGETDLSRWFLLGALLLLLADIFIALWLRGLLGRAVRIGRATAGGVAGWPRDRGPAAAVRRPAAAAAATRRRPTPARPVRRRSARSRR